MRNGTIKNSGLTLIEVLVAMGIFSIVISIAIGIFVNGSGSQRKILEINEIQREANYLMETVSRELRMATAICDNGEAECGARDDQQNNEDSKIEFKNYDGDWIEYCRSNPSGNCTPAGKYISRNNETISSSDVRISYLKFFVTDDFNQTQPIVTIVMKIKSTGRYGTEFILQNSVSMRLY